jgi:hypothetical protein
LASSIERGTPGRGSSWRPSSRCATKRARHLQTVCGVTPSFPAIARCAGEHDAGPQRQSLRRRSPPGQAPQRFLFSLAQSENRQRTTHDLSSSDKIMNLMRISD